LVYLSILLFPNSYIILFWEFYFLPCPNQRNLFNPILPLPKVNKRSLGGVYTALQLSI
jgi:hypothetical protein